MKMVLKKTMIFGLASLAMTNALAASQFTSRPEDIRRFHAEVASRNFGAKLERRQAYDKEQARRQKKGIAQQTTYMLDTVAKRENLIEFVKKVSEQMRNSNVSKLDYHFPADGGEGYDVFYLYFEKRSDDSVVVMTNHKNTAAVSGVQYVEKLRLGE